FSIQFGDAAPLVGADLDAGDILQQHGRAMPAVKHDLLQITDAGEIAFAAYHELGLAELDHAPADIAVAVPDRLVDLGQRNAIGLKLPRVDDNLVLLNEAPDRGHLGHAFGFRELIAHEPILQRPELGQAALRAGDGILVDPANAGRIGSERRGHTLWQRAL